jgi:hypothetical protein
MRFGRSAILQTVVSALLAIAVMLVTGCGTSGAVNDPLADTSSEDSGGHASDITDSGSVEVEVMDTGAPELPTQCLGDGCPGMLCSEDADCQQGPCRWHISEKVCGQPCGEENCPDDWQCVDGFCRSKVPTLCRPCVTNDDCQEAEGGGQCKSFLSEGSFCTAPCDLGNPCPGGFYCKKQECFSESGTCSCSMASIAMAAKTECELTNEFGTCSGYRQCSELGLSSCDAVAPSDDVCDGLDNDCNGDVDTTACNDGNECTSDTCNGAQGCVFGPITGPACDDGDECTLPDVCSAGECKGEPMNCDDNDPCTADTCVSAVGCVSANSGLCTCQVDSDCPAPEDRCLGDVKCMVTPDKPFLHCLQDPSTAVICLVPPGVDAPCLIALCEPSTGECYTKADNDGDPCNLGSTCTTGDHCVLGVCAAGTQVICDDANPCTDDVCVDLVGCENSPNTASCDDGDACTEADLCLGGECKSGTPLICDDLNVCTSDQCNNTTGCQYDPTAGPCDDGDPCSIDDQCTAGVCQSGSLIDCDDGVECTVDACDGDQGCTHTPTSPDCCEYGETPLGLCYPPLTADAGPDILIQLGATTELVASAAGGAGGYEYTWKVSGASMSQSQNYSVTPAMSTTYHLEVTDSIGNTAVDKVTVQVQGVNLNLCEWNPVLFEPEGHTQSLAQWMFDPTKDCAVASQIINAKPSILLSNVDFQNGTLTGQFYVNTKTDDDLIGIVFGYKSKTDFYVFDWKQATQTFCGAKSYEGMTLKRMLTGGQPLNCHDFFTSLGTPNVTPLTPTSIPGWEDFVKYTWTLKITGETLTITVKQGAMLIKALSADVPGYSGGRFGFYNNSQDSVVYEYFQFAAP